MEMQWAIGFFNKKKRFCLPIVSRSLRFALDNVRLQEWNCSCSNRVRKSSNVSRSLNAQGASLMSTSPVSAGSAAGLYRNRCRQRSVQIRQRLARVPGWQSYITLNSRVLLSLLRPLLITSRVTGTHGKGEKVEQVTDDAYVRGDAHPSQYQGGRHCARGGCDPTTNRSTRASSSSSCRTDDYQARRVDQAKLPRLRPARAGIEEIFASGSCRTRASLRRWPVSIRQRRRIAAAEAWQGSCTGRVDSCSL